MRYEQKTEEADKQCALLAFMGSEAFKRFFDKVPSDKKPEDLTYSEIVEVLKKIYEPGENLWTVRLSFRGTRQLPAEPLEDFEARVRQAGRNCKWTGDELQMNLIEHFIGGLNDQSTQQAILVKCATSKDLSEVYGKTEELINARKSTSALRNLQSQASGSSDINKLQTNGKTAKAGGSSKKGKNSSENRGKNPVRKCYRCGNSNHLAPERRFKEAECSNCKIKGHLAAVCRKAKSHHHLEDGPFNFVEDSNTDPIEAVVKIHDREVTMEIDTGSCVSTMEF